MGFVAYSTSFLIYRFHKHVSAFSRLIQSLGPVNPLWEQYKNVLTLKNKSIFKSNSSRILIDERLVLE